MSRRPSFLAVFFTLLAIVFTVALVVRLRSYRRAGAVVTATHAEQLSISPGAEPVATATIVDGTLADGATAEEITRARQRKLEEILRAAPPPAASSVSKGEMKQSPLTPDTAPATASPSIVERVGGAVAGIFGGGTRPSAPPSRGERAAREPSDADSDIHPPQLLGVEFTPPQIRDGESTTLWILSRDDVSGVATVTGVIASPSGSVQGFAAQREGETNRYLAKISVPADAPAGVWRINNLNLSDQAKNSITLTAAQGLPPSASFRVASERSDSTPPTLTGIWLDKLVMRAGERNLLFVNAEDDKSGVAAVTGVFLSPSKTARISFGCTARTDGAWECPLTPPVCLDCGRWQLEQLQIHDKARNMAVLRADQPMVSSLQLDIIGEQCDSGTPHLSSVVLQPNSVSNAEASTIVALATITDDTCGVSSVSGNAVGPSAAGSPRIHFSFTRGGEGQPWTANISVPKHAASGTWRISSVQVLDRGQNLKVYNEADPVLTGVAFRVQ